MSRICPQCLDANRSDPSTQTDVLLLEEPDEEEGEDEDDRKEDDEDEGTDDGYSERACRYFYQWVKSDTRRVRQCC